MLSIYTLLAQDPTTEAVVCWIDDRSGADGSSQTINYGTDEQNLNLSDSATGEAIPESSAYVYHVFLSGLSSDTAYFVEVEGITNHLETFPASISGRTIRIADTSDLHIDGSNGMGSETGMIPLRDRNPDILLFQGDTITTSGDVSPSSNKSSRWIRFFRDYMGYLHENKLVPILYVPGNHDTGNSAGWEGTDPSMVDPDAGYQKLFYPVPYDLAPAGKNYCEITIGDYLQVLALDSHSATVAETKTFVENNIAENVLCNLAIIHSPIFPNGTRSSSDNILRTNLRNALFPLIGSVNNMQAIFTGHIHNRSVTIPLEVVEENPGGNNFALDGNFWAKASSEPRIIEFGGGYNKGRSPGSGWWLDVNVNEDENQFYFMELTPTNLKVDEVIVDSEGETVNTFNFPLEGVSVEPKEIEAYYNDGSVEFVNVFHGNEEISLLDSYSTVSGSTDGVVNISPENGATGVSRTPTLTFTEEGEIPANRYYQIMAVAIATQGTTPDFNEGIKVTQEWVDQENQEFTFPDELPSEQWHAWKILPKTLPTQSEFIDTFDGDDEPLDEEDWEAETI